MTALSVWTLLYCQCVYMAVLSHQNSQPSLPSVHGVSSFVRSDTKCDGHIDDSSLFGGVIHTHTMVYPTFISAANKP